jgi:spermidine synthase
VKKWVIFWGLGFSGMAALIYEIHWTREISLVIGSTTYALSTVLAAFLSGLAAGAFIGGKMSVKRDPFLVFGYLQFAISVTALFIHFINNNLSPFFAWTYYSFKDYPSVFFLVQYITVFLIILIPTSLMGASFPFAMKAYAKDFDKVSEDAGSLYSINTVGSVLGAILCGFILIPYLGLGKTEILATLINLTVALFTFLMMKNYGRMIAVSGAYVIVLIMYLSIPSHHSLFNLYYANRLLSYDAYEKSSDKYKIIWEKEDVEGTVQVALGGDLPNYGIRIKGKPEGTLKHVNDPKQLLMAYLPIASRPEAKSFLKIGLGPGVTLFTASQLKTITTLDAVEINGAVVEAVQKFFYPSLFTDARINFIVDDARRYLSWTDKKYDIITSQPSDPTDQSSGYLFTKEFYEIVRSKLSTDGIYCQFIPFYLLGKTGTDIIVKTFATVFPNVYGWNLNEKGSLLLIGSLLPNKDHADTISKRVLAYNNTLKYAFFYGAGPEQLRQVAMQKDIPVNTDDKDLIEFIAARNLLCTTNC